MSLSTGIRVGPYEIVSAIGAPATAVDPLTVDLNWPALLKAKR